MFPFIDSMLTVIDDDTVIMPGNGRISGEAFIELVYNSL